MVPCYETVTIVGTHLTLPTRYLPLYRMRGIRVPGGSYRSRNPRQPRIPRARGRGASCGMNFARIEHPPRARGCEVERFGHFRRNGQNSRASRGAMARAIGASTLFLNLPLPRLPDRLGLRQEPALIALGVFPQRGRVVGVVPVIAPATRHAPLREWLLTLRGDRLLLRLHSDRRRPLARVPQRRSVPTHHKARSGQWLIEHRSADATTQHPRQGTPPPSQKL